jgi:WD40 repeat protein
VIVLKSTSRAWIKRLAFAPSGTAIAAAAGASNLLLWNELTNGKKAEVLKPSPGSFEEVAYTPDGEHLLAEGSGLHLVRLATREATRLLSPLGIFGFAPTLDSSRVIVCEHQYSPTKTTTRNTCWSLRKPDAPLWEAVVDLSWQFGPFFVTGDHFLVMGVRGVDFCVQTRSTATGQLVSEVFGPGAPEGHVALSPDATRLANASGVFLRVWPVSGPFHDRPVTKNDNKKHFADLAYHPSGNYLATASNDETIKFFDTTTWELVRTFTWKTGKMRAVCFSPDGTLAAAGGEKGQVVVWDVDL